MLTTPLTLTGALQGDVPTAETLRGAPTLLLFWNVGCAGCVGRALPHAEALARRYPALRVIGLHSHFRAGAPPLDELRQIRDYWGLSFPIVLDDGDASYRAFGAEGTPHWVLLDAEGKVWRSFFGSMEGQRHRLDYALTELLGVGDEPG